MVRSNKYCLKCSSVQDPSHNDSSETDFVVLVAWRSYFSHQLDLVLDERFAKMNMFCGISKRSTSPQASLKTVESWKHPRSSKFQDSLGPHLLPFPQITNETRICQDSRNPTGNFNHLPRKSTFRCFRCSFQEGYLENQNDTEVFIRCGPELLQGSWTEGCWISSDTGCILTVQTHLIYQNIHP